MIWLIRVTTTGSSPQAVLPTSLLVSPLKLAIQLYVPGEAARYPVVVVHGPSLVMLVTVSVWIGVLQAMSPGP